MNTIIYGRTNCGFCSKAVKVCERNDMAYEYIDIREAGLTKEKLTEMCGTPVRTVPQIFIGDTYIGGFTELQAYVRNNS